jgi:hypothetical protein
MAEDIILQFSIRWMSQSKPFMDTLTNNISFYMLEAKRNKFTLRRCYIYCNLVCNIIP